MGTIAVLRRLDDETIATLLAHPRLIQRVLSDEEDEDDEPVESPGPFDFFLGRAPVPLPSIYLEREDGDMIDLDKAWSAIHFILTGSTDESPHPLGFICGGGKLVGKEEMGLGFARAFSSTETRAIAGLIETITREEILRRFNRPALLQAHVYPEVIWESERDDELNKAYVADNFDSLRTFLLAAAAAKQGFVIHVG